MPPNRVLGVLAGDDMPIGALAQWVLSADFIIAADAGADRVLAAGRTPDLVVGDMDSISAEARGMATEWAGSTDQETTDCEKLLQAALDRSFPRITMAGFEGDHLDHLLASVQAISAAPIEARIAFRRGVAHVVRNRISIEATPGSRVSLIPIIDCEGVSLTGVEWPLEKSFMSPIGARSISNRALGGAVYASVEKGVALLFEFTDGTPNWA